MLFKFAAGAFIFWLFEFLLQYVWLSSDILEISLVLSFAFTGATLISASLLTSPVFKWFPRLVQYWRIRRYLGVSGAVFALLHALGAYYFYFAFDLARAYPSFNPFINPIVFGSLTLPILLVMAITSIERIVKKLGGRAWKMIHRLVYPAAIAMIFHFLLINPPFLLNPAGYLLLAVAAAALFGQLYWFFKTARQRGWHKLGTWIGIGLILIIILLAYSAYV